MQLGGNKQQLIDKLITAEEKRQNPQTFNDKLKEFLNLTEVVKENIKFTALAFYNKHYNVVDKLNFLLSLLKYPYRIEDPIWCWFVSCVILVTVNSWVLYCDLLQQKYEGNDEGSLKQYVKKLVLDLLSE
jgi:hypothetical protein